MHITWYHSHLREKTQEFRPCGELHHMYVSNPVIQQKDLARLLPARSLHLSAANIHCSGVKELSGPMKGATEAVCRPVPEGRNRGKVRLIPSSGNDKYSRKRVTHLCTEFPLLCWIATVLEGLFGEYHSSSAALGQQRPEVTKTTTCTWLAGNPWNTYDIKPSSLEVQREICAGVNKNTAKRLGQTTPCEVSSPKCSKCPL